eukprot:377792-Rhodomonas_salina.1
MISPMRGRGEVAEVALSGMIEVGHKGDVGRPCWGACRSLLHPLQRGAELHHCRERWLLCLLTSVELPFPPPALRPLLVDGFRQGI